MSAVPESALPFRFERPAWMAIAACRGADADVFFAGIGSNTTRAKELCANCPVRDACLDYALRTGSKHGVWGGLSPRERDGLGGRRRTIAVTAACGTEAGYYRHLRVTHTTPCGSCRYAHTQRTLERRIRHREQKAS